MIATFFFIISLYHWKNSSGCLNFCSQVCMYQCSEYAALSLVRRQKLPFNLENRFQCIDKYHRFTASHVDGQQLVAVEVNSRP